MRAPASRLRNPGVHSSDGKAHLELAAESASLALCGDRSAVQLHQASDERQADAQPASRALALIIHLREHLENAVELIGGHADAAVPHHDDDLVALTLGREPDSSSRLGVLTGVVEQIAEDLRQPHRVGIEEDRLLRQRHVDRLLVTFRQRTARFDGVLDDRREIHPRLSQLQLVPRDSADVEQIVNEADHVRQLTSEDVRRMAEKPGDPPRI